MKNKNKILNYHQYPYPGKIFINTKHKLNANDLSLAYTPGVALPCQKIYKNNLDVYKYTNKGNLVAIITNGTAVLGLGSIGALASKPVMEGKSMLFKTFANIDAYDIEINETNPNALIKIIKALEPTFGGINLEDIKAPECFYIEKELKKSLNIPIFHDDQHGTAIVVTAAILNALLLVNKKLENIKLVVSGAGAAALACVNLLINFGLKLNNVIMCDSKGVINKNRPHLSKEKIKYAINDNRELTLTDVLADADIFLGCSTSNILTPKMINLMTNNPIILALANPSPEINPKLIPLLRKDAIIFTGRSDLNNQVNNVLCFPFIFRAVLDIHANSITTDIQKVTSIAIAELVRKNDNELYFPKFKQQMKLNFNKNYLIPKIFDPNLMLEIVPKIIINAIQSGITPYQTIQEFNLNKYKEKLINLIETKILNYVVIQ